VKEVGRCMRYDRVKLRLLVGGSSFNEVEKA